MYVCFFYNFNILKLLPYTYFLNYYQKFNRKTHIFQHSIVFMVLCTPNVVFYSKGNISSNKNEKIIQSEWAKLNSTFIIPYFIFLPFLYINILIHRHYTFPSQISPNYLNLYVHNKSEDVFDKKNILSEWAMLKLKLNKFLLPKNLTIVNPIVWIFLAI